MKIVNNALKTGPHFTEHTMHIHCKD